MLLALAGCAAPESACRGLPGTPSLVAQIFLGRGLPGGKEVSDAAWADFLATEATPRLPDGLTVLDAGGQWRGPDGRIERERSKLLVAVLPDAPGSVAALQGVAEAYKARFAQQSVGVALGRGCAAF